MTRTRVAAAGLMGTVVAAGLLVLLVRLGRGSWPYAHSGAPRPEDVLHGLLGWVAAALCAWLALGSAVTTASTLPGALGAACQRVAARLTPRLVRQGIAICVGTAVGTVSLPAGSAMAVTTRPLASAGYAYGLVGDGPAPDSRFRAEAAPPPGFSPTATPPATSVSVDASGAARPATAPDPGWRPSPPIRVVDPDETALLAPAPRPGAEGGTTVTVRRGDSLWAIVGRQLGPEATDLEIARAWPDWYAANRAVIGADPDLLVPGQQLRPPTGEPR